MLTQELKDKLLLAIERAEEPGACKYFDSDGKPLCVVGQLIAIEQPDFVIRSNYNTQGVPILSDAHPKLRSIFSQYGMMLLNDIQNIWDAPQERDEYDEVIYTRSEAELKKLMIQKVEEAFLAATES